MSVPRGVCTATMPETPRTTSGFSLWFTMSESRRVKWDQLNYYDHPAFGVVALVTPADRGTGGR